MGQSICVIGSLNIDYVYRIERFPSPGETLTANSFAKWFGGKGGNQAVALRKLGADVAMVGKIGDDEEGQSYIRHLSELGVRTDAILVESRTATGSASIQADSSGENQIILNPGANERFTERDFDHIWEKISDCDLFLLQLEIPLPTVLYAVNKLKEQGKTIILDPAPARELPDNIYPCIDYFTPNESELAWYTCASLIIAEEREQAARILLHKGVNFLVAKAGQVGAFLFGAEGSFFAPAYPVDVADTIGAGDCFNAAFAFALSENERAEDALRFANAAAALSTRSNGSQNALPSREETDALMRQYQPDS